MKTRHKRRYRVEAALYALDRGSAESVRQAPVQQASGLKRVSAEDVAVLVREVAEAKRL